MLFYSLTGKVGTIRGLDLKYIILAWIFWSLFRRKRANDGSYTVIIKRVGKQEKIKIR